MLLLESILSWSVSWSLFVIVVRACVGFVVGCCSDTVGNSIGYFGERRTF